MTADVTEARERERYLVECVVSDDGCCKLRRKYGEPWNAEDIERVRAQERDGLLVFVDSYRLPFGDYVRRSTITPTGFAALGSRPGARVLGMLPDAAHAALAKVEDKP